MARPSFIIVQSLVEVGQHTSVWHDKNVVFSLFLCSSCWFIYSTKFKTADFWLSAHVLLWFSEQRVQVGECVLLW